MASPILTVEGLHLHAGGKLVLRDLDLSLPATGMTALMGPVGTGKSSLVKWLCGRADPTVYKVRHKTATYFHRPHSYRNRPPLYGQRQGQALEQMMLHLSVLLSTNPALLCVDEPTADLSPDDSAQVMERLARIATGRAILLVSHRQAEVEHYADQVVLMAGGEIKETAPARQFFQDPRTEAGQQFVGSGWVATTGLDTPAHHLNHELRKTSLTLSAAPAGADGRLLEIVPGKLYFYHAPEDAADLADDAAEFLASGRNRIRCMRSVTSAVRALLGACGLAVAPLPAFAAACGYAEARTAWQDALADMEAGIPVILQGDARNSEVARAIGLILICMDVPAELASRTAAAIIGKDSLDPLLEQELWDFELSADLDRDGVDPEAFRVGPAPIGYADAASLRQTRPRSTLQLVPAWQLSDGVPVDHSFDQER